jgi:G3E family GTPase
VHGRVERHPDRAWRSDERQESRLVVIGTRLDGDALRQGFRACLA